jgi:hypothetical protein
MVVALGFNYSTGGDGGDIVPYVKYDARAGRFFRNDRTEVNGKYTNNPIDITGKFKAVMDLENVEWGWIMFASGTAPAYLLVPSSSPLPPRPPDGKWKQGARVMMKLDATCGGDVRETTSNAQAFLQGFDDLDTEYKAQKAKNPGLLPIVILRTTEPVTTGAGDKKSTNYKPVFEIVGWSTRPADLVHVAKRAGSGAENPYE